MIIKGQLQRIMELKRLSLQNAEKDYLLELMLYALSRWVKSALVFKGGTALYKLYGLNRFSEDLDFTLMKRKSDIQDILEKVRRDLSLIGINAALASYDQYSNEINARFLAKGPLYTGDKKTLTALRLNISLRERVLRKPVVELLISQYNDIPSFQMMIMDKQEILAEKIRAICTREKARDVYDLWFLLKRGTQVDETLVKVKLQYYHIAFSWSFFLTQVEKKRKNWNRDLQGLLIGDVPSFDSVLKEIRTVLRL